MEFGWRQCLGWLSGKRATPLLGIDIGSHSVRILELSRAGSRWRVEHFARRPLPHGAIRDGSIVHPDQVTEALTEALRDCGTHLRQAALALPSGMVIRKTLSVIDGLSDEALELQVEADAEQSLPFSLEELSLDFGVIGPSSSEPGHVDVMLVAARKEKIDERLSVVQAAGLRPLVVDVESQALVAAIRLHLQASQPNGVVAGTFSPADPAGFSAALANSAPEAPEVCALIQLGRESSQFSIVSSSVVVFERELSIGLHKLDQETSRRPDQAAAATQAFHDVVCQEIKRALQLYATTADPQSIHLLLLAGPSDKLALLPAVIGEQLGLSVQLANPFSAMERSAAVPAAVLEADASACLIACGLAILSAQP